MVAGVGLKQTDFLSLSTKYSKKLSNIAKFINDVNALRSNSLISELFSFMSKNLLTMFLLHICLLTYILHYL